MDFDAKISPPLRLAFVGGGINSAVGNVHRISSQLDGRWKLVGGVFSSDAQINAQSAVRYGLSEQKCFHNLDELIQSKDEFDAVSVLSPTNLHYEHILKLITNGIQVVSEKSMVGNVKDAFLLVDQEDKFQKKVYVTFNYTAYPMIRELKSRIEENQIGRILNIHVEMPQEGFLKLNGKMQPPNVQKWRTVDGELSTVSLDLGVHTQNLIQFATGLYGESFVGVKSHHGLVSQAVDYVSALGKYNDGVDVSVWYGKTALGHRNGLRLRVFGEHGSFEWEQVFPDRLVRANQTGVREIIDFGNNDLIEASKARYQRFKPGHPTGFIEAFANYYEDLYNVLSPYGSSELSREYLASARTAAKGLQEIRAIEDSCSSKEWEEV
jgi:predicted dehydrogenase